VRAELFFAIHMCEHVLYIDHPLATLNTP